MTCEDHSGTGKSTKSGTRRLDFGLATNEKRRHSDARKRAITQRYQQSENVVQSDSSKPRHRATIYTRAGCHLCEDAHVLLQRYSISVTLVDIDQDPELRERYDQCVPVVWIDDRERFRGRIDETLLRRLLRD